MTMPREIFWWTTTAQCHSTPAASVRLSVPMRSATNCTGDNFLYVIENQEQRCWYGVGIIRRWTTEDTNRPAAWWFSGRKQSLLLSSAHCSDYVLELYPKQTESFDFLIIWCEPKQKPILMKPMCTRVYCMHTCLLQWIKNQTWKTCTQSRNWSLH